MAFHEGWELPRGEDSSQAARERPAHQQGVSNPQHCWAGAELCCPQPQTQWDQSSCQPETPSCN